MAYTPNNNPYIPGDPYSYDLKWMICQIKKWSCLYTSLNADFVDLKAAFDDLKKYVTDFIDDLDIRAVVSDKIDEMIESGELAAILARVFPMKNTIIERYGRILASRPDNVLLGQGTCYHDFKYYVCGNYNNEAVQVVSVWNDDGTFLASREYTTMGHANDICYNDGKLYVAGANVVHVIDADSLDILEVINHSGELTSVNGVCTDGTNLYMIGNQPPGRGIDRYNLETGEVTHLFSHIIFETQLIQGCEYYQGGLYQVYLRGAAIARIDLESGQITDVYKIPDNDGYYWLGELETPFMKNGIMCISAAGPIDEPAKSTSLILQLFKTNITGSFAPQSTFEYDAATLPRYVTLDANSAYSFNPYDVFTAAEEINALYYDIPVRIYGSITQGYISRARANTLTLIRIGGSPHLDAVTIRNGVAKISEMSIGTLMSEYSTVNLYGCTISALSARFSRVDATASHIKIVGSVEKTVITANASNFMPLERDTADAYTPTSTYIKQRIASALTNWADNYTKMKAIYDPIGDGRLIEMHFSVLAGGRTYQFSNSWTHNQFQSITTYGITDAAGNTISLGPTDVTLTVNGSAVSVPLIIDFVIEV